MSGAARPLGAGARLPAREQANRLRALADLVDDALAALGAQPAFASEAVHRRPSLHGGQHSITGSRARRRAARNLHLHPEPPGSEIHPGDPSDADRADGTVEDEHAETWRLVALAQGGDGEAFGLLYDLYVDMVFRFIYVRVNDRALAEDFTSETFLRALRRIGSISYQGRDIGAWFVTIARNIVFDHTKSARNRLESTTGETMETKDHVQSTENAVLDTLQSEHLMAAVARLGDDQRECVMLRFVHGLSVNETASVMGKNDGAIKALQHRAVRKLADLVGSELR